MSKPIRLSDSELDAVIAAARPLDVGVRDAFLQAVADALVNCVEIGPGTIHRKRQSTCHQALVAPEVGSNALG